MAYSGDPRKGLLLTEHDPDVHDLYSSSKGGELIYRCTCGWSSGWVPDRWVAAKWARQHLETNRAHLPRGVFDPEEGPR